MKTALILFMVILSIFSKAIYCQEKKITPIYCNFTVSDEIKQSNTNFTDGFLFKIDRGNKPIEFKGILRNTIDFEEAKKCLGEWSFFGFQENTRVYIYFTWKHAVGFNKVRISSKKFSQNYYLEDGKYIKIK